MECRWGDRVTLVPADMRSWAAPEQADIIVSELLGSFGDNELSPECLDGAQSFLKPDGVSIPSSYTSYLQPITTAKLWNDVKARAHAPYCPTVLVWTCFCPTSDKGRKQVMMTVTIRNRSSWTVFQAWACSKK